MTTRTTTTAGQPAPKSTKACLHIDLAKEEASRTNSEQSASSKGILEMIKFLTERYRFRFNTVMKYTEYATRVKQQHLQTARPSHTETHDARSAGGRHRGKH